MTPAPDGGVHPELASLIVGLVESYVADSCPASFPEELAVAWLEVKEASDQLSIVCKQLESRLAAAMKNKVMSLDGIGTFEKAPAVSRKSWDHPLLAQKIVAKALDSRQIDSETGEVEDRAEVATKALLSTAGISYWRVGEVKKLGIDPDQYCDKEYGAPRVKYTK